MLKKMQWIGLTGGIATGKSTAAEILRKLGYPVIDADAVSRQAVGPGTMGLQEVVRTFGQDVLLADGSLDRKKMATAVFDNPQLREKLEIILHPLIQAEVARQRQELEKNGHQLAIYDVPLLFEKNLDNQFDQIILVYAPEAVQMSG